MPLQEELAIKIKVNNLKLYIFLAGNMTSIMNFINPNQNIDKIMDYNDKRGSNIQGKAISDAKLQSF